MLRLHLIIMLLLLPRTCFGEDFDVGDKVFLKPDANATIDGTKVDVETVSIPAVVSDFDDDQVFIGNVGVAKQDVMSVDEALKFYSDQIRTSPKNSMAYVNRGRAYAVRNETSQQADDFNKAIADFDRAIELDPKNAKAFRGRGAARLVQGEAELAMKDLNDSIRLDRTDARSYFNRSKAWMSKKKITSALADCNEAVKLDPKNATYRVWAGELWSRNGDFDKSIEAFTEAITIDPENADAYAHRGEMRRMKREFDGAIEDYSTAIELEPDYSLYHYYRAVTHIENKQYQPAIDDVTEAVRLNPKYAAGYSLRASCWIQMAEYQKADADFAEAIKLNATREAILNNYAWFKATCPDEKFRDGKTAVKYASKACELSHYKVSKHLGTLAAAYAESGDFTNAVKWQSKAIETSGAPVKVAKERLELYRAKKPFRDVPQKSFSGQN